MADLKDRLERLKKERQVRSRTLAQISKDSLEKPEQDDSLLFQESQDSLRNETEEKAGGQPQYDRDPWEEIEQDESLTFEEKLEKLRKEQEVRFRPRSRLIKDSWERIGRGEGLSTKEKLEQLISLSRREKPPKPKLPLPEPFSREPLRLIENPFPLHVRYGRVTLSSGLNVGGDILTCLSNERDFQGLDLSTALFLDLETTGLSGGTGVIPFLVGLGYYRDDRFWIAQYFLGDPAEEGRMIEEISQLFSDLNIKSIVSYNGKAFDIPLLETRFILCRKQFVLSSLPHLDFLFPARSLWKHKYESCRLYHLAREVVQADRSEDIPSAEIPWRYFQYLQTGNYDLIEPVLYHNQEDLLSLLGIVIIGAQVFSENPDLCLVDAMDFYGAGRIMEKAGNIQKSMDFFQRALDGRLSEKVSLQAKRRLSSHFKRNQGWEQALTLWKEMAGRERVSLDQLFSLRELAMYFEHRERNYEQAKIIAEQGFVLSRGFSSFYEEDFQHRLDRLNLKISKDKKEK